MYINIKASENTRRLVMPDRRKVTGVFYLASVMFAHAVNRKPAILT
jgi:hypothetical protein